MRTAVEEVQAVMYMLHCLGVKVKHASLIYSDNMGVIHNCTISDSLLDAFQISEIDLWTRARIWLILSLLRYHYRCTYF